MTRIRQQNVTAAQWSSNGEALGALDLTLPENEAFGANVFSVAVQRERLPDDVFEKLQATPRGRRGARPEPGRRGRRGDEGLGAGERRHPLHPHLPAADRLDRGEARLLLRAGRRGQGARRLLRQGADPGRARRLLLPDRRRPRHLRGPRLHRLGPDQPRLHPREPERGAALHPDRLRLLDRRGARREDPAAALDGRALALGDQGAAAARRRGEPARLHHGRARAGVLPDRRAVLLRAPRPDRHRPHPVRRQAAEGPRARRPLLRLDPRAGARLHDGVRTGDAEARHPGQDPPQRGRAGAVRDRADLRELQRRLRPPAAADADAGKRRPPLRPRLPAAREAVRRRQRLRQAQQLVDGHRQRAATCSTRATRRRTTSTSSSSARR